MLGASYGWFATELRFSGDLEPALSEQMIVASASRLLGRFSVRASAGAIVDGRVRHDGREHDVGAGWLASLSGAHQWTFGADGRWFATATLAAGMSSTRSREPGADAVRLTAVDVRLGALAGVTLAGRLSPYVLARAFGGPVQWRLDGQDVTGTDQHHYQLGVGASVRLPLATTAIIDASLLGERSVSIGVGLSL